MGKHHPRQHRILMNNQKLLMLRALRTTDWDYKVACIKAANEAEDAYRAIVGFFVKDGEECECTTCGASGRWSEGREVQRDGKCVVETNYEDAIWWNPIEGQVECVECWLK